MLLAAPQSCGDRRKIWSGFHADRDACPVTLDGEERKEAAVGTQIDDCPQRQVRPERTQIDIRCVHLPQGAEGRRRIVSAQEIGNPRQRYSQWRLPLTLKRTSPVIRASAGASVRSRDDRGQGARDRADVARHLERPEWPRELLQFQLKAR